MAGIGVDFSKFAIPNKSIELSSMPTFQTTTDILDEFYTVIGGDENNICEYVKRNYATILDTCMEKGVNQYALTVVTHPLFLQHLEKLLEKNLIVFEPEHIIKFNCVCYDYSRLYTFEPAILNCMIRIVCHLNNAIVMTLMGFKIPQYTAAMIVAARYSTLNTRSAFLRTIKTIQRYPAQIMTEQTIIDILGKTCVEPVTDLFIAMMFDTYTSFNSEDSNLVYSTMSNAVLNIVESLPTEGIKKVLTEYLKIKSSTDKRSRFMLKSISTGDFPRINSTIDMLEYLGWDIF